MTDLPSKAERPDQGDYVITGMAMDVIDEAARIYNAQLTAKAMQIATDRGSRRKGEREITIEECDALAAIAAARHAIELRERLERIGKLLNAELLATELANYEAKQAKVEPFGMRYLFDEEAARALLAELGRDGG